MKERLITLSQEIGFLSKDKLVRVHPNYYYLWMCELQRWLREKHDIDVITYPSFMGKERNYYYVIFKNRDFDNPMQGHTNNYSYEEAMELGLIESLKLLPLLIT